MKTLVINEIEKILKKTLHPAPARGEDAVSGVMPVNERQPFRYALKNNALAGLNLAGAKLTDAQWQKICALPDFDPARIEALNLRDNQLKTSPVPAEMKNLRYLDLCGNQLKEFGLPSGSGKLEHLWLYGNKTLSNPPVEIVKQGNAAILNYFREREQGDEKIKEAKLLILGEGGAGKTTLARKILNGFDTKLPTPQESTHGIEINDRPFSCPDGKDFTMHVWDFGGQEIYHATHQFFLTKRSLYVLVADVRKEDTNFDYWLQVVELLSDNSPVIIVQNRHGGRTKDIDESGLRGRFSNLKAVVSLDLSEDRPNFNKLFRKIKTEIQELSHVDEAWPTTWAEVRRELEAQKKLGEHYLPVERYFELCGKQGLDDERALRLSQFLHDFGVFLHFQDDVLLKRTVFLNNDWVTKGVYAVLDDPKVIEAKGYFSIEDAKNIWKTPTYHRMSDELLQLMSKFELCFRLPDDERKAERYLTPHLLSAQTPDLQWEDRDNLELRYHYDFMPKGLLSRLIVRLHRYLPFPEKEAWRTGAVFHRQGAQAKLVETYGMRNLFLRAKGAEAKGLVTLISDEIDHLNKGYHSLRVKKLVPCNCAVCRKLKEPNFYEFEDLMRRKERGKKTVECKNSYEDVNVLCLIDDVFVTTFFAERPKKIFISYSQKDAAFLKQLKTLLAPLEKNGLLQPWDDTKLLPGEEWDASIRRELNTADIILLLVSPDLMATDYVWNIEMKEAMARHERGDAVVVPVIIRPSLWKDAPFAKLNALPQKGKAISTWSNPDEAWLEVGEKIREIAEIKNI